MGYELNALGGCPMQPTWARRGFDAVYVPRGTPNFDAPGHNGHAQLLVKEAYKHGKASAASDDGVLLIDQAAASAATQNGAFKASG